MIVERKSIFMAAALFIAIILISCSGGTIPVGPDNGDDGNGDPPVPNDPPSAVYNVQPTLRAYKQFQDVNFDASMSTDPDNNIAEYEWDFHYDDANFNIDATGPSLDYSLPSFGSVVAAVRVVDAGDPALTSVYRSRLNVEPSGELANVTNGNVDNFILREGVESNGDFYCLYTGEYDSTEAAWVQRSSDGGATWGDPVQVSDLSEDLGPWGIWLSSAPFGIGVGWIATNGDIKYTYGVPEGIDSITFAAPQALDNAGTAWYEPVLYSIAVTDDGNYAYLAYLTTDAYELKVVAATLDSSGGVASSNTLSVAIDNADRFKISGVGMASAPNGRAYITHIWKSLGYDNADEIRLYYLDPPGFSVQGPIRVDNGLDGFVYNHDPYVIANNDNEPIVVFRTTGLYKGGKDIALCLSDGDPPVFRETIRANNTLNGDSMVIQNSPTIAIDRDHGHIWIAFEDFRDREDFSQVYMTMFDDQYSTLLPDFDISLDPSLIYSDINPRVSFREGDNPSLVVIWERDGTDIVAYHASY